MRQAEGDGQCLRRAASGGGLRARCPEDARVYGGRVGRDASAKPAAHLVRPERRRDGGEAARGSSEAEGRLPGEGAEEGRGGAAV
eukprot:4909996-Lingulodinium_polyedra.AAC.1